MAYRDDLQAALDHAAAAERDLAQAKAELSVDEKRIVELVRELDAAKRRLAQHGAAGEDHTPRSSILVSGRVALVLGVLLMSGVGTVLFLRSDPPAPAPPVIPATPPAPAPPRAAPAPPSTAAAATEAPPAGRMWDVSKALGDATELARQKLGADVQLVRIAAPYVDEQGMSRTGYGGEIRYSFTAPSRASLPAPTAPMLGAPVTENRPPCKVTVRVNDAGALRAGWPSGIGAECAAALLPGPPRCTLAGVWRMARAQGAPSGALATVGLEMRQGKPTWSFRLSDGEQSGRRVFDRAFPDSCD